MKGMSKIVQTITSITFPFVLIYGLYIIAHGHLTPGGGFQGGAVRASTPRPSSLQSWRGNHRCR